MKNKTPYIVIAILFVIYNVIAFVIPTTKTSAFWICYAFTVISFAVQAYVWYATIGKKQDLKRMLNISQEIQNTYNTKADQLKPIQDNIIKLLNDNPDFNQTLHSLNLSEEYYGQMNLTHLTA